MTAPKGPKPKPLAERFNAFVDRSDADGCWIWTGSTASTGYGQMVGTIADNNLDMVRKGRHWWADRGAA